MKGFLDQALRFIADYQWWLYGSLGLILLFFLRRALLARRESARSIFKLEQEQARGRYTRGVITTGVVLAVLAAVIALANVPMLRRSPALEPTAKSTAGILPQPTLTSTPLPPTITPTGTPTRTPTRRPVEATPTSAATATPVVRPPNCPNPDARITSPGINQAVSGQVPIRGTANTPNFQYYKIEVGVGENPGDQQWSVVGQTHDSRVIAGELEVFNSDAYAPGVYSLRLVVVDVTGNYPEPCKITVTVQR